MTRLYSLRDTVSCAFFAPFLSANDESAMRSVVSAACMDHTIVSENPDDFDLYYIGEFDDSSGCLTPFAPTILIKVGTLVTAYKDRLRHGEKTDRS